MRAPPAPLSVEQDSLGVFGSRFVGEFSIFERSAGLPHGAKRLVAAGRDPGEPDFVAYRLGKGLVVRTGTPQWARATSRDEVSGATKRIWALLRR
jgi:hypothetical protein